MAFLLTLLLPWWPLSPWLSPAAAWFIFFNAVVSAIAVMSTSGSGSGGAGATPPSPTRRLCRSGSSMVLDRLRSLFIFSVEVEQLPIDESSSAAAASHCCWPEAEAASATERNSQAAAATTGETAAISSTAQPSASVAVATAVVHAPSAPPTEEEGNAEKEQEHDESAISLDEAYALAHRHRTKPLASPPSAAASATAALPTEHKKVVADWRRVPKAGEALEGKAELNARADLFIRQFREELKLQRLNSVLNHTHALG
ncbi:uncharacterized protein LOC100276385 [Zea mays]|uniref:DUF4408 domain-containing protein n=1 Tax=Zea mays TaxID=4577 RepID=A0A1D6KPQ0_MAIZE|nr:uncharacterized protein LOC100276385 [Zea mays]ONM04773.1 hypothetical protein ZEAMMB73_Zm00001d032285 [Zea mays]|eukprot:NP_001143662.2 uncharacterized protein LOC100276385 [Zea mays]